MNTKSIVTSILAFASNLSFASQNCDQVQTRLDGFKNTNEVVQYLKLEVEKQKDFVDLFVCSAGSQRLPTELIDNDRDYIYGNGWGSLYANASIPNWNQFQSQLGRSIWGGKILKKTDAGVSLLNVILPTKTMNFAAQAYNAPSLVDGEDSILLDYRNDQTVKVLSPLVIERVRDELRELSFQGEKTGIYLGRAYLYTGLQSEQFSPEWQESQNFVFAANFFLDFRTENQSKIPAWAVKYFE
ncbi:MAG: hypothetical protein NTX25_04485 [Proteobacteria bacterium]|nr:hypothetical protein [Pseudomonadota bacterium]